MKLSTAPTCYFTIIEDCLLACKTCKHAVWPHEVDRHLRGSNHRLDKQGRDEVIAAIHDLPLEDTNQFQPPAWRDSPYSELMLYNDGLMCKKDHCGYVCRKVETIRKHWRSVHQWSISGQSARTGLTREQKKAAQRRFDQSVERVFCQRFFPSQNHSQYFRVGAPEPASQLPATEESLFSQMCKRARERMELSQATEEDRVQEGSKDEANPWLRRTGWLKYLKGFSREQLLSYVAKPEDTEDESESVEQVIWRTVEEVGSICQATVSRCSPSIRMEAVRTEKHQTQHKPLETYWDPDAIHRRTDPWKKMLMFFVRTQLQIDAEARPPKYEFTSKQEQTFRTMLDLATAERERREAEEVDESRQVSSR
jgi:hypothetical protein